METQQTAPVDVNKFTQAGEFYLSCGATPYFQERQQQIQSMSVIYEKQKQELMNSFGQSEGITQTVTFYGADRFHKDQEIDAAMPGKSLVTSFKGKQDVYCRRDSCAAALNRIVLAKIKIKMESEQGDLLVKLYQFYYLGSIPQNYIEKQSEKKTEIIHDYAYEANSEYITDPPSWALHNQGDQFSFTIKDGGEEIAKKTWICQDKSIESSSYFQDLEELADEETKFKKEAVNMARRASERGFELQNQLLLTTKEREIKSEWGGPSEPEEVQLTTKDLFKKHQQKLDTPSPILEEAKSMEATFIAKEPGN